MKNTKVNDVNKDKEDLVKDRVKERRMTTRRRQRKE